MAQIYGEKNVTLVDPVHSMRVYSDFAEVYNLSPLDPLRVRRDLFPEAAGVPVRFARIQPGDLLYLPILYWHQLTSGAGRNVALTFQFGKWTFPRPESHYSVCMNAAVSRHRAGPWPSCAALCGTGWLKDWKAV